MAEDSFDRVVCGDCLSELAKLGEAEADLVFADPPFNIGYEYDEYYDTVEYEKYTTWTRQWMQACLRVLKPDGSMYVAIGDEYAAEIRFIGRELGLYLRNWIIWYYTFGQSTSRKFARSHAHIFYFVKDRKRFFFDDKSVRVLSDRQKEYKDRRANAGGKLPDDVWTQFPRICGTFRERLGDHPCQMPEALLVRIIRASCPRGGLVVDPFAGSGTTLVAAAKLGRQFYGIELSKRYADAAAKRVKAALQTVSQPGHADGWPEEHLAELKRWYQENEVPTDRLNDNPGLLMAFVRQFNARLGRDCDYEPEQVMQQLKRLRTATALPRIRAHVTEKERARRRAVPARREAGPTLFDSYSSHEAMVKRAGGRAG